VVPLAFAFHVWSHVLRHIGVPHSSVLLVRQSSDYLIFNLHDTFGL
jgi:hypothetical protein